MALLALALHGLGCAADASNGHEPDGGSPAPTSGEIATTATTAPDTTAPASPSAPASARAASGGACLMFYHCACNVGCSKVATPREELRDGLAVEIVSGVNSGSKVFVAASKDKAGQQVFSLTHNKPGAPMPCAIPAAQNLMAYPCDTKKSGELDPHACDSACP
jgi:hypothetical protein